MTHYSKCRWHQCPDPRCLRLRACALDQGDLTGKLIGELGRVCPDVAALRSKPVCTLDEYRRLLALDADGWRDVLERAAWMSWLEGRRTPWRPLSRAGERARHLAVTECYVGLLEEACRVLEKRGETV